MSDHYKPIYVVARAPLKLDTAFIADRTRDLQIFSLTLSQLSYKGWRCTIYVGVILSKNVKELLVCFI